MNVFERVVSNPYCGILTLTKFQKEKDISRRAIEGMFDYTRLFLWHPNFVYLNLFGDSRTGKFRIEIQDQFSTSLEDAEWAFAFPFKLKDQDKLFITNHENYYSVEIEAGIYYVVVEARQLTYEEIKNDKYLMKLYERAGLDMPLDVEIPYLYNVIFCKTDGLKAPQIIRFSDRYSKMKAIIQEQADKGVDRYLQALERNERQYEKVYVLSENHEPVSLEESNYNFS
ncbi:MAG: hypothetical protein F6K00_16505 [Leptolyngbya sp. SIOISBB]|nr:hypothetical protein [Leptolyngbya sp. SIOISBB]